MAIKRPTDFWGKLYWQKPLTLDEQLELLAEDSFKAERFIASSRSIHPVALQWVLDHRTEKYAYVLSVRLGDVNFTAEQEVRLIRDDIKLRVHAMQFARTIPARQLGLDFVKGPVASAGIHNQDIGLIYGAIFNLARNPALTFDEAQSLIELVGKRFPFHSSGVKVEMAGVNSDPDILHLLSYDKNRVVVQKLRDLKGREFDPSKVDLAWSAQWFMRALMPSEINKLLADIALEKQLWDILAPQWEGSLAELVESAKELSAS